jgi:diadenosine tetraphosphate (Ap4A) HIT family hydrolase
MKKSDADKRKYKADCTGCKISQEREGWLHKWGGVIKLDGGWVLNHYKNGFLGWMMLQPDSHRENWTDLDQKEASALGHNIQKIENSMQQYWRVKFKRDPLKRLYVVYFCEFSKHLHIHIIPRPKSFERLIVFTDARSHDSEIENSTEKAFAWKTYLVHKCPDFPKKYKIHPATQGYRKVKALMQSLAKSLEEKG